VKFWIVTVAAFVALLVGSVAALGQSPKADIIWAVCLLSEAFLFPWFGYLLGKRR
jgi:hypothetical protein